jgi:electron transfer flavoprotein alpha/beta subunit
MKAKKKPLDLKTVTDFGLEINALKQSSGTEILGYQYPAQKPAGKILKDEPVDVMVGKLTDLLRNEAKVI